MHQPQHLVGTALQGNVEVGHESTRVGTIVDELVAEQIGLQTADAIAPDAFHRVQSLHQVQEALVRGLAKITNVHSREDNLLAAFRGSLLGLGYKRLDGGIAREAAGIGNGAVGAEIIAAVLNLEEVARAIAARAGRLETADVAGLDRMVFVQTPPSPLLMESLLGHKKL